MGQGSVGKACFMSITAHIDIHVCSTFTFLESEEALGFTPCHCADASHLTYRVQGLDPVKCHAKSHSHRQVIRSRHDEHQVEGPSFLKNRANPLSASARRKHDEPRIHVNGQLHPRQSVQATHTNTFTSQAKEDTQELQGFQTDLFALLGKR